MPTSFKLGAFLAAGAVMLSASPSRSQTSSGTAANTPGFIPSGISGQAQSFGGTSTPGNIAVPANPPSGTYAGPANPYTNPAGANSITTTPYGNTNGNYGGFGGYYPPYGYYESDIGGFMRGTADIITAQGQWFKDVQNALAMKEKYKQEQLATRRKKLEEYLYERDRTPTAEDERQRQLQMQISRSLNDPPSSEIWSGQALNNIIADIRKVEEKNPNRPAVNIDDDVLRHLNLSPGIGNPGLLRNEGRLHWPLTLQGDDFKSQRELLNSLAPEAVRQAVNGRVDPGSLKDMVDSVAKMRQTLNANIRDLTPNQFIEANRFLSQFDDALKILGRPDAGDLIRPQLAAKSTSVADLLKYMGDKGLVFAPAVSGDESAYAAIHKALVAYDNEVKGNQSSGR
jgi:hypothetical protein